MKVLWTTVRVNDMAETLAFYKEVLGEEPTTVFTNPMGEEICFLGTPEDGMLELISGGNSSDYSGVSIGVPCTDVAAKHEELIGLGYEPTPLFSPNPHLTFFFVKDPNGLGVQFAENK